MEENRIGNIYGFTGGNYAGNVYDKNSIAPCINTMTGGNRQPMIVEVNKVERDKQLNSKWIFEVNGESYYIRIRKLTPKECFRLMGFNDEEADKAASVNSNTQLYKEAGNSIAKSCLIAIFSQLNIKGVTPWNELSEKERVELIKSTTRDWDNG